MDNQKIVMVVDDAAANLQHYRGLLSGKYDVRLAKSGIMALDALSRIEPDVILLDIEMPNMSGFEVKEEINHDARLKNIPVIFISSHTSQTLIEAAINYGAVDYVTKPFLPNELYTKITKALTGKDQATVEAILMNTDGEKNE